MAPQPERQQDSIRINRRIRVPEVRVIDANGDQLGILPTFEALKRAEDAGLDLVEVSPKALPPVCRLMDFGKYRYLQKQKAAEQKKSTVRQLLKEIKLHPKIGAHDLAFKLENIRGFMKAGHKAKVVVQFKGREIVHQNDFGRNHLDAISKAIVDEGLGIIESAPRLEGRNMILILAPTKNAGAEK